MYVCISHRAYFVGTCLSAALLRSTPYSNRSIPTYIYICTYILNSPIMGHNINAFPYIWLGRHSYCKRTIKTVQIGNSQIIFLGASDFPFENDEILTFQDCTSEFRDLENIKKDILHCKSRVFLRSVASPQQTVKCDKSESLGTPDAHMGSCAA